MIKGEGSQTPDKAELSCTIREKECVANCIKAYAGQQSLIVRLSPFLSVSRTMISSKSAKTMSVKSVSFPGKLKALIRYVVFNCPEFLGLAI